MKEGRKDGRKEGGKEGRKGGRKDGRKEGRKEGRRGRSESRTELKLFFFSSCFSPTVDDCSELRCLFKKLDWPSKALRHRGGTKG